MTIDPRQPARLSGLDGLRAVAAITVLTFHVALRTKFAFVGPLVSLVWELKGGVAVFFVISGAVLYLPYARAIRDQKRLPEWRPYAWRRAVRILPAYWIALTAFALLSSLAGVFGPYLMRYYSLSQIYGLNTMFGGLPVAWSLCVEVTFYVLVPFLATWAARRVRNAGAGDALRAHLGLIALLGLVSLALRSALAGSLTGPVKSASPVLVVGLPGFLDWFAIGMALAVIAAEWEVGRTPTRTVTALAERPWWCALLALAAFGIGVPGQHGDLFLPWYGLLTHVALGVGSGFLVLGAIGVQRGRRPKGWTRMLGSPRVVWAGTISYGIYLWHPVLLQAIGGHHRHGTLLASLLLWTVVLLGAVVLGAASWYVVERPLQRLIGRLLASRRPDNGGQFEAGRLIENDEGVHSTFDPLNSPGVAVDHLA